MAIRYDTVSRNGQHAQWMAGNIDLRAPDLHDFSDLHSEDGRPSHMLRWIVAIAAILAVSHVAFGPSDLTMRSQASIDAPSLTAPL